MKCAEIRLLLTSYAVGESDAAGKKTVEEHLETCCDCRASLQKIRSTLDLVQGALAATQQAPARLAAEKRQLVLSTRPATAPVITWLSRHRPMLARVAAVLVVGFVLISLIMPATMKARNNARRGSSLSHRSIVGGVQNESPAHDYSMLMDERSPVAQPSAEAKNELTFFDDVGKKDHIKRSDSPAFGPEDREKAEKRAAVDTAMTTLESIQQKANGLSTEMQVPTENFEMPGDSTAGSRATSSRGWDYAGTGSSPLQNQQTAASPASQASGIGGRSYATPPEEALGEAGETGTGSGAAADGVGFEMAFTKSPMTMKGLYAARRAGGEGGRAAAIIKHGGKPWCEPPDTKELTVTAAREKKAKLGVAQAKTPDKFDGDDDGVPDMWENRSEYAAGDTPIKEEHVVDGIWTAGRTFQDSNGNAGWDQSIKGGVDAREGKGDKDQREQLKTRTEDLQKTLDLARQNAITYRNPAPAPQITPAAPPSDSTVYWFDDGMVAADKPVSAAQPSDKAKDAEDEKAAHDLANSYSAEQEAAQLAGRVTETPALRGAAEVSGNSRVRTDETVRRLPTPKGTPKKPTAPPVDRAWNDIGYKTEGEPGGSADKLKATAPATPAWQGAGSIPGMPVEPDKTDRDGRKEGGARVDSVNVEGFNRITLPDSPTPGGRPVMVPDVTTEHKSPELPEARAGDRGTIETKFVDISENELKELGFEWKAADRDRLANDLSKRTPASQLLSGTPVLGDIPVTGRLFRKDGKEAQEGDREKNTESTAASKTPSPYKARESGKPRIDEVAADANVRAISGAIGGHTTTNAFFAYSLDPARDQYFLMTNTAAVSAIAKLGKTDIATGSWSIDAWKWNETNQYLGNLDGAKKYRIKPGDTLSGLAKESGVTVDELLKLNSIKNANSIKAGAILLLPAKPPAAKPAVQAPVAEPEPTGPVFKAVGVNPVVYTKDNPFSTFAMDVDTASYTLARNYMMKGFLPPAESVRTEEFVNFFDYACKPPTDKAFAIYTDCAPTPFQRGTHILKIGVEGQRLVRDAKRRAVLTFVIDTSGSMSEQDRLPLVQKSLRMLIDQLDPADSVAIIQYDSHARLVLDRTPVAQKKTILDALYSLQTSGSTNLEEGMREGYRLASRRFVPGAANRVLLLSDGAANLGSVQAPAILNDVEAYRKQGIYCSVFGFGIGTYNDDMLKSLASKGDGTYAFIDSMDEAKRVFIEKLAGTLNVIAKDAKIQVEFNPDRVKRYRQIGYEERQLTKAQFRDDTVDAGEVGSGQAVTALYELELDGKQEGTIGTVRVRYKNTETGKVE
ncbi:MAG: von Willebrand factor type A domain-containing protein, partial [bacterium]